MSIVTTYPFPYYEGLVVAPAVPGKFSTSLNGRTLPLDVESDRWRHVSIQLLRQQADQASSPSESSLNPEGLWRRAQDSWHHGAGQTARDRVATADGFRFRSSKGIDPWTYYQINLLPDTDQKISTASTNLYLTVAGARIYSSDNQTLRYTASITPNSPTFTTVTGTAAVAINGLASDGFNIYIAQGASGIYKSDTGISTAASWATGTVGGVIGYVKGRLMCSNANSIYNVTAAGALPAAHFTHPNAEFDWVGFAAGYSAIYAAGFSGDKSLIYRIGITQDSVTLEEPIVAGELPDGEIVRSIGGYLGFIFLGTDKGVRLCSTDTIGNLVIGPLIATTYPVYCFEGQERFMWFGWTNYDGTSTGLGRMDLTAFTESIETGAKVPAYASDLMVTGQGTVQAIATFNNITVFTVSGLGVYAEWTDLVASGTLDTGTIGYGLPDDKVAISCNVRTKPLVGSYIVSLAADNGTFASIGSESDVGDTGSDFPTDYVTGEQFELRFTLTRDAVATTGPTITRYTLKSSQAAVDGPAEYIFAPFLLHRVVDIHGVETALDVHFERDAIKGLRTSHQKVVYQESEDSYEVFVEGFEWIPYQFSVADGGGFGTPDGTMVVQMKRIN